MSGNIGHTFLVDQIYASEYNSADLSTLYNHNKY